MSSSVASLVLFFNVLYGFLSFIYFDLLMYFDLL